MELIARDLEFGICESTPLSYCVLQPVEYILEVGFQVVTHLIEGFSADGSHLFGMTSQVLLLFF
jgi:hypothetical protein